MHLPLTSGELSLLTILANLSFSKVASQAVRANVFRALHNVRFENSHNCTVSPKETFFQKHSPMFFYRKRLLKLLLWCRYHIQGWVHCRRLLIIIFNQGTLW